jgi:hypothetical protein
VSDHTKTKTNFGRQLEEDQLFGFGHHAAGLAAAEQAHKKQAQLHGHLSLPPNKLVAGLNAKTKKPSLIVCQFYVRTQISKYS